MLHRPKVRTLFLVLAWFGLSIGSFVTLTSKWVLPPFPGQSTQPRRRSSPTNWTPCFGMIVGFPFVFAPGVCDASSMPKQSSKRQTTDPNRRALLTMLKATSQEPPEQPAKNPHAVALGKQIDPLPARAIADRRLAGARPLRCRGDSKNSQRAHAGGPRHHDESPEQLRQS